jgi:hypothetical protein
MTWDCAAERGAGVALAVPAADEMAAATPTNARSSADGIRQGRRGSTDRLVADAVRFMAEA